MGYAKPSLFTFEDYRWAVSAVMTRQNKVPLGGTAFEPEFGLALIPLWDMINHANGELTSAHDIAKQVTECAAMQPFAQGEQIVMFYGPRPNAELLLHSGFVMEGNPHDFVTVKLGVGKSDPLGALKAQLLEALTIPRAGDFVIDHDGELDPQLNAFIRINAMAAEELRGFLGNPASCATLGDPAVPASEENEEKACSFIETRWVEMGAGGCLGACAAGCVGDEGADGGRALTRHGMRPTQVQATAPGIPLQHRRRRRPPAETRHPIHNPLHRSAPARRETGADGGGGQGGGACT